MLENIKSSDFIQLLFSYLDERIKLRIINYNKSFQNIMNITLMNYKLFSRRFIIYEDNGIAKEYNSFSNYLVFEGEYLNGKRNGKGKEYDDGKLVFEGEYLNGKRNGKGKEYDVYGTLIFEGEYLNGQKKTSN